MKNIFLALVMCAMSLTANAKNSSVAATLKIYKGTEMLVSLSNDGVFSIKTGDGKISRHQLSPLVAYQLMNAVDKVRNVEVYTLTDNKVCQTFARESGPYELAVTDVDASKPRVILAGLGCSFKTKIFPLDIYSSDFLNASVLQAQLELLAYQLK